MAKRLSAKAKAAQILGGGATLDMSWLDTVKSAGREKTYTREVESVLRSLHKPHQYMMKKCKNCGDVFETNYCYTAYCSDECLAVDLAKLGIVYDPYSKKRWESRMYTTEYEDIGLGIKWEYEEPEYISTQTLDQLAEVFREWLKHYESLRRKSKQHEDEELEKNLLSLADSSGLLEQQAPMQQAPMQQVEETAESSPVSLQPSVLEEYDDFLTSLLAEPRTTNQEQPFS